MHETVKLYTRLVYFCLNATTRPPMHFGVYVRYYGTAAGPPREKLKGASSSEWLKTEAYLTRMTLP